jgi:ribose transport system permease protein
MNKKHGGLMTYAGTIGALLILCIVLSIATPNFLKVDNLMSVFKQTSFNALLSAGMLLCLITAGIDRPSARMRLSAPASQACL